MIILNLLLFPLFFKFTVLQNNKWIALIDLMVTFLVLTCSNQLFYRDAWMHDKM